MGAGGGGWGGLGRQDLPDISFDYRPAIRAAVLSPLITRAMAKLLAPSTADSCQTLPTPF